MARYKRRCAVVPPPATPRWASQAYSAGRATRDKSVEEIVYSELVPAWMFDDFEAGVWFEAGRQGAPAPTWTTAWRYGEIPEGGQSKNYRDNQLERGVSVMAIDGEPPVKTLSEFGIRHRRVVCVGGWLNPLDVGGDGEPLLISAQKIPKRARR